MQVHPVPLAEVIVIPCGTRSVSVTTLLVGSWLTLVTSSEYVPVPPAANVPECVFVKARSGVAAIVVRSVAVLLAGFASPPPATVAVLTTLLGAAGSMDTETRIGGAAPEPGTAPTKVHVTVGLAMTQLQPVPAAATALRPDGNVSVTVT